MLVYVVFSRVGIYLHHKHTICNQPCLNITWPSPMAACPACCCWGEILLSLASDLDSWSGMLRCCYIWPQHITSPQLKQHLTAHGWPGLYRPDCRQADGGAGARVDRKQNFVLVSSVDPPDEDQHWLSHSLVSWSRAAPPCDIFFVPSIIFWC